MQATSSTVLYIRENTTQVLHTGSGADRWNRFLTRISHAAEPTGYNPTSDASIVARWWSTHPCVRANRTAAS